MRKWFKAIRVKYNSSVQNKLILTIPAATVFFWAVMIFFNCFAFYQQTHSEFIRDGIEAADNLFLQSNIHMKDGAILPGHNAIRFIERRNERDKAGNMRVAPDEKQGSYSISRIQLHHEPIHEFTRELSTEMQKQYGYRYFSVGISDQQMRRSILQQVLTFVGIGIVMVFAQILVIILFAKTITRPLYILTEGVKRLVANPSSHRDVPIPSRDEVGQLAECVNEMVHKIRAHEDDQERNRLLLHTGKLSASVAHDIRSPLSSLRAGVEILRRNLAGDNRAMDAMNLLQLSSRRLEDIANDLLVHHQGKPSSGPVVFSIHEVLDELIGEMQGSPIGRDVTVNKQYHSAALYVKGDKNLVMRAIANVIKNALEAMQQNPGGMSRELTVSTVSNGNKTLTIHIVDTGPGIPAEKIPLILRGGHTDGKSDGHGIGTRLVREVMEMHQGALTVESTVGEGTTFILELPAVDMATTPEHTMTVTIPYSGIGPVHVIDDDPGLREQWRLTLREFGVTVETYTCWEDFEANRYYRGSDDVLIVDYHFNNSKVDGLGVIRRLKAEGCHNIVLATAEYWKPVLQEAAREMGLTLCPKPLPKVVLQSLPKCSAPPELPLQRGEGKSGPSILVIDDDVGIHAGWKAMRNLLGIGQLSTYTRLEEMIAASTNPADYDVCVIDKNIEGSQYDGARMLEYLKQNGAVKVILASGERESVIRADPGFAAIDGIMTEKIPMSLDKLFN